MIGFELRAEVRAFGAALIMIASTAPVSAQMSLADIKPGMEHSKVVQELSKHYGKNFRIDDSPQVTLVNRWIEKEGKMVDVTPLGSVFYKEGLVNIIEEQYGDEVTNESQTLLRALINEVQGHLRQVDGLNKTGTARIVLRQSAEPEMGGASNTLFIMFGDEGIQVSLRSWKIRDKSGAIVELARRRESAGK